MRHARQHPDRVTGTDLGGSGDHPAPAGSMTVLGTRDHAAWLRVLESSHQHDFHHLPGYHRLAEWHGEGRAHLFVHREAGFVIGLPLLLRPVDPADADGLQDATSVYGYAGPVASHPSVPAEVVRSFQAQLESELVGRRVVTVFSRLHPLIAQREMLAGLGEICAGGVTVSVDLTLPPDEQWAGYSKKTRRIIRKAEEAGITCSRDQDGAYRAAWVDLYRDTMRRVGASDSYLYDADYFDMLAAELGPMLQLFVALDGRALAAAGLFTICDGIVQAHLGAMNRDYAQLSPARLVDDTARRWATEAGARIFHLGGGVGGQEDSLFQYKAGFSDRRHSFSTWRWIVDEAAYRDLCRRRGLGDPNDMRDSAVGGYFPAYRRPTEAP